MHLRPVMKLSRLIPRPCVQSAAQLPEAFVVLGFAFYLQPMMMPLLHDMPPGPSGLAITSTAVKIVIIGGLATVQLCYCAACYRAALSLYSLSCTPAVGHMCMSVSCLRKDRSRAHSCVSSQCCQAVNTWQGCSEWPALERQDLLCMYLAHH